MKLFRSQVTRILPSLHMIFPWPFAWLPMGHSSFGFRETICFGFGLTDERETPLMHNISGFPQFSSEAPRLPKLSSAFLIFQSAKWPQGWRLFLKRVVVASVLKYIPWNRKREGMKRGTLLQPPSAFFFDAFLRTIKKGKDVDRNAIFRTFLLWHGKWMLAKSGLPTEEFNNAWQGMGMSIVKMISLEVIRFLVLLPKRVWKDFFHVQAQCRECEWVWQGRFWYSSG